MQHQPNVDASCPGSPLSDGQRLPNFRIDSFFWRANSSPDEVTVGLSCLLGWSNIVLLNIDTDSLAPTDIAEKCERIILRRTFVSKQRVMRAPTSTCRWLCYQKYVYDSMARSDKYYLKIRWPTVRLVHLLIM